MDKNLWGREIAVLLNENARKVSKQIIVNVRRFVPEAQLYISKSLDDAQDSIRDMMNRNFTHVVCGGGDGTVVETINMLRKALQENGGSDLDMPKLGFLKLGTGNAWSGLLGMDSGKNSLPKMGHSEKWRLQRFNLLESENRVFHFAGMGWDAAVLNDYYLFKNKFYDAAPIMRKWMNSLIGYFASMFTKTIPEQLLHNETPRVRLIARTPEAYRISHGMPPMPIKIKPGETLYEGPANVLGAGTTTDYGFKLRAFPFAHTMENFMNFRIVKASLFECLTHMRSIWDGTWTSPNFIDMLVKNVTVESDRPMPFQIGGDAAGMRNRVDFSVADLTVQVLSLA